ncbi:hypothetical protein Q0590_08490 [Rhodocytophaga aerolata]|uniref:Uncharacterized protein n=1 Tax=Rhodocytophaga aerolata TaxID=455078 RepID=A0ABT8R2G6_9BACT|nr:hypothetical protein [Rhodocytophaga aerolata]MDO1446287.1 hypothetical protein [Rhodocytophaga aerolata]
MKNTKAKQPVIKDADTIINEFTASCDVVHAGTVLVKLYLANAELRRRIQDIHPDQPYNVDTDDEKTMKAISAVNAMLYEIEKTMKVEV